MNMGTDEYKKWIYPLLHFETWDFPLLVLDGTMRIKGLSKNFPSFAEAYLNDMSRDIWKAKDFFAKEYVITDERRRDSDAVIVCRFPFIETAVALEKGSP